MAHFFRRAFTLVRDGGTFGLIATNTIAQGDTRFTGLRWICTNGGDVYRARRRAPWPGLAAVVVSVLHVHKGPFTGVRGLDDAMTERITAFLFHRGGHDDPARLAANAGKSFVGSYALGMGFTFDDTDTKGVASPLAHMRRLALDPRNAEAIFPYIGGEEVNTSPTHEHHRFIINFRDYPLRREDLGKSWAAAADDQRREWLRLGAVPLDYPGPVAADWPDLLRIVEERVKPGAREGESEGAPSLLVAFRRPTTGPVSCHRQSGPGTRDLPSRPAGGADLSARRHGVRRDDHRFSLLQLRRLLHPPIPPPRKLGALLRVLAGRPAPLHTVRLLETFPFPRTWKLAPTWRAPASSATTSAPT